MPANIRTNLKKARGYPYKVFFILFILSCQLQTDVNEVRDESELIHVLNSNLTNAILQDGFSPPVASRIYAYCNIAAYECLVQRNEAYRSLTTQLNDFSEYPIVNETSYDEQIALIVAFSEVAKELVYRDYIIDSLQSKLLRRYIMEHDDEVIAMSLEFGQSISRHIIEWSSEDGYNKTRNYPLYTPLETSGTWVPTPPTYKDAIEPYWGELRTFILDSASQFTPSPPDAFSPDSGSTFYQAAYVVYEAVNNLDSTQLKIARHWDCNPAVSINTGHMMYAKRQLTPGGHWMGIVRLVTRMKQLDLLATTNAYTRVSLGIADGFISSWDEKYRSHLIRPETYIQRYIDVNWRTILETPMFPEHTSAHSVISASAATVLTDLFGENFEYLDSVNVPFGLPPRFFNSFYEAADEAAVSRLYGGIHYRPAIEYGLDQGKEIGTFIVDRLNVLAQ
ncbi:MAG TPA: phosphatase PAP2 family protein [Rhodospirillales bacterium]|nr:phosphatase PAP2 family protein [Flavobacteriales bacterium]HIA12480.1 phosphatase PAP2 family protein [Flavobacteriales bacterium]HIB20841.1 phosphatase PAP2 family protein [Rhodospirillales bacterium]HIO71801.1 phosphatase PAP2 family protein [Flavobacteriales bacterium]